MGIGKIKVEIQEDYPGAQWYSVRVYLPGYGADHEGFVLVNVSDVKRGHGEFARDILGEAAYFRPEYAKAIKSKLEGV